MARDLSLQVRLSAIDRITAPLRRIVQGSGALAQAMKASQDQLKALNQQQRDLSGYRQTNVEIARQTKAIQALQARTREHTQLLEKQRAVHVNLKGNLKAAQTQYNKLAKALIEGKGETASFHFELEKAQIKLQSAQQAFNRSSSTIKTYKDRIRQADSQLAQLGSQQQNSQERLAGYKRRLDEAGIGTERLGSRARQLRGEQERLNAVLEAQKARLAAVTAQQERLTKAQKSYERAQAVAGKIAIGGAASLANGYALSRPLSAVMDAYAPAEDAAAQLRASMMGADGSVSADFEKISALATRLGDRLPGTTAQFQEMMTMLRRQGISAQSILGGTGEAAAYLAVQLKMGSSEAAEFAAKMQDSTRTTEADMMGLMDTIQRTFYLGVDPTNMLQGFASISPALSMIRKSGLEAANTLAPLLVMMDQAGMSGESAGNALRNVFQSGFKTDKVAKANKMLKKLGISLDFTDGKGEFGGLEKLFAQLQKLQKLTTEKRTAVISEIFGDDSQNLQVLNTLIDKGLDGYREVEAKMKAQADLRKRVDDQLKTLTNVIDAAQGSWTNAMAEFGAAVAPELKGLIQWLGNVASGIGAWARENPQLAGTLVKVTAGIGALAAAGGALAIGMAGLIGPFAMAKLGLSVFGIQAGSAMASTGLLGKALGGLSTSLSGLGAAWQAASLGTVLTALPGRLKAAASAAKAWVASAGSALVGSFRAAGSSALAFATAPLRWVIKGLREAALAAWMNIRVNGLLGASWNGIKAGAGGLLAVLRGGFSAVLGGAAGALRLFGQAIVFAGRALLLNPIGLTISALALAGMALLKYWQPVKAFFGGFWQGFTQGLEPLAPAFAALGSALAPLKPLWDGIAGAMSAAWQWVSRLFAPFQATATELQNATSRGQAFGLWLAGLVNSLTEIGRAHV